MVKLPNLASDDVIVPGTANLSFNIELTSTADPKRKLVSDLIGRTIIQKLAVKFEGNEILCIDDFDIFACYRDLWKAKSEKINAVKQGIISIYGYTENCMKLRINAADKTTGNAKDKAIADAYGNKFIIPLEFEMLEGLLLSGTRKQTMLQNYDQLLQPSYQFRSSIPRCHVQNYRHILGI